MVMLQEDEPECPRLFGGRAFILYVFVLPVWCPLRHVNKQGMAFHSDVIAVHFEDDLTSRGTSLLGFCRLC